MRLTQAHRRLLVAGTNAQRPALRILETVARVSGAQRLVRIGSAHVSGASYKLMGDAGLGFLEDFARDATVAVPTTVNPLGTDLAQWRDLGVPPEFAEKQDRIARAYVAMGVQPIFSCTPYLLGARPKFGEHLAWAESNAVCFANSVLGARSNRESGPSALAAAIVGATPHYGLHTDRGRLPTVVVTVDTKPRGIDYSLIGLVAGEQVGAGLPGPPPPSRGRAAGSSPTLAWRSPSWSTDSGPSRRHRARARTTCRACANRRSSSTTWIPSWSGTHENPRAGDRAGACRGDGDCEPRAVLVRRGRRPTDGRTARPYGRDRAPSPGAHPHRPSERGRREFPGSLVRNLRVPGGAGGSETPRHAGGSGRDGAERHHVPGHGPPNPGPGRQDDLRGPPVPVRCAETAGAARLGER